MPPLDPNPPVPYSMPPFYHRYNPLLTAANELQRHWDSLDRKAAGQEELIEWDDRRRILEKNLVIVLRKIVADAIPTG
jgi:hypothetical protein